MASSKTSLSGIGLCNVFNDEKDLRPIHVKRNAFWAPESDEQYSKNQSIFCNPQYFLW